MMYQNTNIINSFLKNTGKNLLSLRFFALKSYITFIFILLLIWSCHNNKTQDKKTDSYFNIEIPVDEARYDDQKLTEIINGIVQQYYRRDFSLFENATQDISIQNKPILLMIDTMYHQHGDGFVPVKLGFNKGYLFDTNFVHMIFTTKNRLDIFVRKRFNADISHEILKDSAYTNVVSWQIDSEIVLSSLYDVNGDGFADMVIGLKDEGGCCLAKITRVYLYMPHCGGFTPYYEFMNPTFFPLERKIRGIAYGHPGWVPLYEKEWVGVIVKDLRYIYPNDKDTVNFTFRLYKNKYFDDNDNGELLKRLPKEFENIKDLEWFNKYKPFDFKTEN